jgi:hypothetical protein
MAWQWMAVFEHMIVVALDLQCTEISCCQRVICSEFCAALCYMNEHAAGLALHVAGAVGMAATKQGQCAAVLSAAQRAFKQQPPPQQQQPRRDCCCHGRAEECCSGCTVLWKRFWGFTG